MFGRSRWSVLLALPAVVGSVLTAGVSAPAQADSIPSVKYAVVSHSKVTDVTDYSHRLGVCVAKSKGISCSISKGRTATRSIGAGFGVSAKFVAGELNISSSRAVTVSVGCSSVVLKKGQKLEAFPVGSKHRYKIRKQTHYTGSPTVSNEYSGWKYTYNPYRTGITCRIS